MASIHGGSAIAPGTYGAQTRPVTRRAFLASAGLLLAPLLLSACGGSAAPPAGNPTATPVPIATAAASTAPGASPTAAASLPTAAPAPTPTATLPPNATVAAPSARPTRTPAPIGVAGPGFGMTMHFMWYDLARTIRELDQIQAAGLTVARFDLSWRGVEPRRKGSYDVPTLTKLDSVLRELDARGISPIITVIETPAWARPAGSDIFTPPTNRQDYADIMGVLAARYASRPNMVWEVWNEPNLPEFWQTGPNPAEYADLLKRASVAIRAADPDATVLGGSIVFNDLKFLRGIYQNGARGSFDGLSLHPYAPGRSPDDHSDPSAMFPAVQDMKAVMVANGEPDKTIWITEMGWGLDLVTDDSRAAYLRRAVELVRSWPYVRTFCVYTLSQDVGPDAQSFGLIAAGGTPSQSWVSYIAAAQGR
jgi:hypothetical protein